MILDYSQPGARRPKLACWLRSLWSHRARVELALAGSLGKALLLLAVIATLAAALSTTHAHLHLMLSHTRSAGVSERLMPLLREDLSSAARSVGRFTLVLAPIYFAALALLLGVAARCWASRSSKPVGAAVPARSCAGCFALLAAASMPVLWLFLLLQLEALAPFLSDRSMWEASWNPVSNLARFFLVLLGFGVLGLWMLDLSRLLGTLRQLQGPRPETAPTTAPDLRYTRPA
jgi:hypothetical protein